MKTDQVGTSPFDQLLESFLERQRRGERPSIEEYARDNPELAAEIRDVFPALAALEEFGSSPGSATGPHRPLEHDLSGIPRQLGEFRILREVGRGGMGVVYEAVQESLSRHVALKVLPPQARTNGIYLERFRREAQSAARLHHTNIVPVFGVGEHEGVAYYAMQYIAGQTLESVMQELRRFRYSQATTVKPGAHVALSEVAQELLSGTFNPLVQTNNCPTTPHESGTWTVRSGAGQASLHPSQCSQAQYFRNVAEIGVQVAEALAYAHGQDVVHRDIKPSNLMLDLGGTVWITDFGLAKAEDSADLTSPGDILGTLRYMSPEQLDGQADSRSDVYSLGITLYELVTLRPAFDDPMKARLLDDIRQQEPPAPRRVEPQIPRDLETIILKAIAKEPARRYQTAMGLTEDLRRFLADRPVKARRASRLEHAWRWCRRNRGMATLGAFLLLLVCVVIPILLLGHSLRLQDQLQKVADAKKEEESAKLDALDKLALSYLQQARSRRMSQQVGHRLEALAALEKAVHHTRELGLSPDRLKDRLRDLRNEAIAALALPDLQAIHQRTFPPREGEAVASPRFDLYAVPVRDGGPREGISVCRVADGEEVGFLAADRTFRNYVFSPDSRFLAAGKEYKEMALWDVTRTEAVLRLPVPREAYAFSPDARTLAVGSNEGRVEFYDLETLKKTHKFLTGSAPTYLAYHPRKPMLVVVLTAVVAVFDLQTGVRTAELKHSGEVHRVAWHPDGVRLATSDFFGETRIWDVTEQRQRLTIKRDVTWGAGLCFNATGECLVTKGETGGLLQLWDAVTGRLVLSCHSESYPQAHPAENLVGPRTTFTSFAVWRLEPARVYRTLDQRHHDVRRLSNGLAVHADGRLVAIGGDHELALYDLAAGRWLGDLPLPGPTPVFDPARGMLLTASESGIQRWPFGAEAPGSTRLRIGSPILEHPCQALYADFSSDGNVVAYTSHDYKTIWVYRRGQPGDPVQLPSPMVGPVSVSHPDGRWVATSDGSPNAIKVWESATGRLVKEFPLHSLTGSAQFSPDGRWLNIGAAEHLMVDTTSWDAGSPRGAARQRPGQFSRDGLMLAVESGEGVISLSDAVTGHEHARLTDPNGHQAHTLGFSPDGSKLIVFHKTTFAVHVWDLRLLRTELAKLDLDWDAPAYGPAGPPAPEPLELVMPGDMTRERDARYARGKARYEQALKARDNEQYRAAAADFDAVLKMDPTHIEAYHLRSHCHAFLGNVGEALADVNKAIEYKAGDPHFHDMRGWFHFLRQEYAEAVPDLLRVLALGKVDTLASYRLAWIYLAGPEKLRDTQQGLTMAERAAAHKIAPPADSLTLLGLAHLRMGAHDKADDDLTQLAKLEKASTGIYLLAQVVIHHRAGDVDKAQQDYDRALSWRKLQSKLGHEQAGLFEALRAEAEALCAPRVPKKNDF